MAQIIDEGARIAEGMPSYLEKIGVTKAGLNYHILSIIGCQSSGKSTLLNKLFNTSFVTMNESTGRQQTTKGIHASYNDSHLLLFDIEGSDSKERGDADALFERKSALFGIALSEVVIVNMWQYDIGRYNAGNIPLLRTVFEVNLQLFASSSETKCHLIFVIRDATQSEELLCSQIRKDLNLIWSGLTLPPAYSGKTFDDFFVFHFFALPHMRLKPQEFDQSIIQLRNRFMTPSDPNYIFSASMSKLIPGDGLPQYVASVWEAISTNKELNLPSQRRTLSNFKCDEFAQAAFDQFKAGLNEKVANAVKSSFLPNFKEVTSPIIQSALSSYDDNAQKYIPEVAAEKRADLQSKIKSEVSELYNQNSQHYISEKKKMFQNYILSIPPLSEESVNIQTEALAKMNEILSSISEFLLSSKCEGYVSDYDLNPLKADFEDGITTKMGTLAASFEIEVITKRRVAYKAKIASVFSDASPEMWKLARSMMNEEIESTKSFVNSVLEKNAKGLKASDSVATEFYKTTNNIAQGSTVHAYEKMVIRFDEKFKKATSGSDDVSTIFEEARDEGLALLKMFTHCQLREPSERPPLNDILSAQLITPMGVQSLEGRFGEYIERSYIDAIRVRESQRVRVNIPIWMWVLIVYFGYGKIMDAYRHPIITAILIVVISTIIWLYKSGMMNGVILKAREYWKKFLAIIAGWISKSVPSNNLPPSLKEIEEKEKEVPNVYTNDFATANPQLEQTISENPATMTPQARKHRHSSKRVATATLDPSKFDSAAFERELAKTRSGEAPEKKRHKEEAVKINN